MVWRLFVRAVLAFLMVAGVAHASQPVLSTGSADKQKLHWRCWYDQQVHIRCLLDTEVIDKQQQPATKTGQASALPKIIVDLRNNPSQFRAVLVRIPMYSDPIEDSFARELAVASMCGTRQDCSVHYTSQVPHHEEISQLLLRQIDWPARQREMAARYESDKPLIRLASAK